MNILQADLLAMRRAVAKLEFTAGRYLIDGDTPVNFSKSGSIIEEYCIPQGDAKYICIAAASIVAKVEHDRWIQGICAETPELDTKYGLLSNMGYGTANHMRGLKEYGATSLHRRSFKPVKDVLGWLGSL
jgi:ribonuclease HII